MRLFLSGCVCHHMEPLVRALKVGHGLGRASQGWVRRWLCFAKCPAFFIPTGKAESTKNPPQPTEIPQECASHGPYGSLSVFSTAFHEVSVYPKKELPFFILFTAGLCSFTAMLALLTHQFPELMGVFAKAVSVCQEGGLQGHAGKARGGSLGGTSHCRTEHLQTVQSSLSPVKSKS